MFDFDTKDVQKLVNNLMQADKNALPKTLWYTLNRFAKGTALQGEQEVRKTFINRNKYIEGSIGSKSKKTNNISDMESRAGQFSVYKNKPTGQLEKQEFGIAVRAKGKHTFAATPSARGGSYKKTIKKANLFSALNVKNLGDFVENPTRETHKEIRQSKAFAVTKGKKVNVLLTNAKGKKGVYTVSKNSVKLLYRLNSPTTNISKHPWLKPATDKVMAKAERIFISEAQKRLQRELEKGLQRS